MRVLQWDVVILVDGGGCMERSIRFNNALNAIKNILSSISDIHVTIGIFVDNGLLPFCYGEPGECLDAIGTLKIVGGRGCWDRGLFEASRLLSSKKSVAYIIGCCALPCDNGGELSLRLYDRVYYFCIDRCPSRLTRLLRDYGFARIACSLDEFVALVRGG